MRSRNHLIDTENRWLMEQAMLEARHGRALISCMGGGATIKDSPVTLSQDNSLTVNLKLNINITGSTTDENKQSITAIIKEAVSSAIGIASQRHRETFKAENVSEVQL
jgi:hypothetical protein